MLTPKAPYCWRSEAIWGSTMARVSRIAALSASGVGCVSAVRNASAPAFVAAATSLGVPTHCIPPITSGTRRPSVCVSCVRIMMQRWIKT